MEESIKPGKILIAEAEARAEKRGIHIGEEKKLKSNIENLAQHLRLQSNGQLSMDEVPEKAREVLTEPIN